MESDFSISNNILVGNLHESSIVAQHHIYDGIVHLGGLQIAALLTKEKPRRGTVKGLYPKVEKFRINEGTQKS